nr:MAG TPA: hypothetical protein [Caudoviricetes sp.]
MSKSRPSGGVKRRKAQGFYRGLVNASDFTTISKRR